MLAAVPVHPGEDVNLDLYALPTKAQVRPRLVARNDRKHTVAGFEVCNLPEGKYFVEVTSRAGTEPSQGYSLAVFDATLGASTEEDTHGLADGTAPAAEGEGELRLDASAASPISSRL